MVTLKTWLVAISSKSCNFNKLGENPALTNIIVRAISPILNKYKIFAKVPYPLIKFDEKHDGEVAEHIQQTILKIGPIFVQKWCLDHPKMILD